MLKRINPLVNKDGIYVYNCTKNDLLDDIVLSTSGKDLTIKKEIYGNKSGMCVLRLRPSAGDFWVLGLQWYQSYATCFNPKKNTVQFNTINPKVLGGFLRDQALNYVDKKGFMIVDGATEREKFIKLY